MSDYIKREDAVKAVANTYWQGTDCECYAFAHKALDNVPTADVAPVRHGHWEERDDLYFDTLYRCSVCGEEFYIENGTPQENQYYYCPNCGARMDGEDDEID